MNKQFYAMIAMLFTSIASADYVTLNLDDGTTQTYVEYNTANGDLLDFESFSDDIRININGVSYMTGAKDWFDLPALGSFDMDKVIDNEVIEANYYDDGAGYFEVLSYDISAANTLDWEISFNFLLIDDSKNMTITGSGCIGDSCAASAVPVPAAVWLFSSALIGLVGLKRRL